MPLCFICNEYIPEGEILECGLCKELVCEHCSSPTSEEEDVVCDLCMEVEP